MKAGDPWPAAAARITGVLGAPTFVVAASIKSPSGDGLYWTTGLDAAGEPITQHGRTQPAETGNGCHRLLVREARAKGTVAEIHYDFVRPGEHLVTASGPVDGCTGAAR